MSDRDWLNFGMGSCAAFACEAAERTQYGWTAAFLIYGALLVFIRNKRTGAGA